MKPLCTLVGILVALPTMASADGATASPEASRVLADIQAAHGKRTAEDRNAAMRLNAKGDSAYKRQDDIARVQQCLGEPLLK